jgi:hypothetical protein
MTHMSNVVVLIHVSAGTALNSTSALCIKPGTSIGNSKRDLQDLLVPGLEKSELPIHKPRDSPPLTAVKFSDSNHDQPKH